VTFANASIPLEKRSRLGKNGSPRAASPRRITDQAYSNHAAHNGTGALIRWLLVEQAAGQWRRYALAFGLMGIAAASTVRVGNVINQAYVHKNLSVS
jgi:hypothetical protein